MFGFSRVIFANVLSLSQNFRGLSEKSSLHNFSYCSAICSLTDNSSSEILNAMSCCAGITFSPH